MATRDTKTTILLLKGCELTDVDFIFIFIIDCSCGFGRNKNLGI